MNRIEIRILTEDVKLRPRTDQEVLEIISKKIASHVLYPNNILAKSKYNHTVVISLVDNDVDGRFFFAPPNIFKSKKMKQHVCICGTNSYKELPRSNQQITDLVLEIMDSFLRLNFKMYTAGNVLLLRDELIGEVSSITYPAPYDKQNLMLDKDPTVRENYYAIYEI